MDQPPPKKLWSSEGFIRESVAPSARVSSVSKLSRSQSHSSTATVHTLLRLIRACSKLPSRYTLVQLLKKPDTFEFRNCKEAEASVCEFVACTVNATVSTQALKLCPTVNTIPSSELQIPDGSIQVDDATVFILEVESGGSWESTTLKLSIHLCKMLASLRNRRGCESVKKLSGFYFPLHKCECVVQTTIEWDDTEFKFCETHESLELTEVAPRLIEVYEHNVRLWRSSTEYRLPSLNYPVSPSYLHKFADDARQMTSGQSVVVICESAKQVYKKNLEPSESDKLKDLLLKRRSHPQIGFPVSFSKVDKNTMIIFDLYSPPLTRKEIQEHATWFSRSLAKAILALHDINNLAHLDIRPENICTTECGSEIVLIDLDRYEKCGDSAIRLQDKYGLVEMYLVPEVNWTFAQLDWKQVGILHRDLFPHSVDHIFVKTLLYEGEMQCYNHTSPALLIVVRKNPHQLSALDICFARSFSSKDAYLTRGLLCPVWISLKMLCLKVLATFSDRHGLLLLSRLDL